MGQSTVFRLAVADTNESQTKRIWEEKSSLPASLQRTIKMQKDFVHCNRNELLSFHNSNWEFYYVPRNANRRQTTSTRDRQKNERVNEWETQKKRMKMEEKLFICSVRMAWECRVALQNAYRALYKFSPQSRAPIYPRIYSIQNGSSWA